MNKSYPSHLQSWGIVGIAIVAMVILTPLNTYLNSVIGYGPSFMVFYSITMAIPLLIAHLLKEKEEGTVRYQFLPKSGLLVVIISICTIALQWGVTGPISSSIPMSEFMKELFQQIAEQMNNGYGIITIALLAPLFEELIFRGIILDGLLKKTTIIKAIVTSSFLFGLVHLNPWQFVSAFCIGIFSGWIYYRTQSLSYSFLIHVVNNSIASLLSLAYDDKDMVEMSTAELYGGAQNMAIIIPVCILVLISGVIILNKKLPQSPIWKINNEPEDEISQFGQE